MAKLDEKMELIGSAIVSQAEQERKSIVDKANAIREQELSACKEQLIEKMFGRVQAQTRTIRQKSIKDKAQAELRAHRELLLRRQELTTSVFAAAKTRLYDYVSTPDYPAALLSQLRKMAGSWEHSASTVFLRDDDLALAGEIEAILPGCRVVADRTIRIGGFRLRNSAAGILVDETLDARLEAQRPWFLQTCGLKTM